MNIQKRDGSFQDFDLNKINLAMQKAFSSIDNGDYTKEIAQMSEEIYESLSSQTDVTVEGVQDLVEEKLMEKGYFKVAKNYIKYRAERAKNRELLMNFEEVLGKHDMIKSLKGVSGRFMDEQYSINLLHQKFRSFLTDTMSKEDKENQLIRAAVELTSKEAPKWEMIAGELLMVKITNQIDSVWEKKEPNADLYRKMQILDEEEMLGKYMLENYSKSDVEELEAYIDYSRDMLFNYSGLDLLHKRYLIRTNDNVVVEKPQEMFMLVAMHLAIPEKSGRIEFAKSLYDIISKLQVTLATPTLSNSRKPYHQLSSCFIDTVPDSLDGIYRSIDNFAQVSKFGGGMGLYFGKVRAIGSSIRGFKGAAGGVVRWIKLANDTAIAVDQLGVRQGSVAVYLDAWHKDIPEFLQLRTNNGDDRMKAHDVFPAVCYPDYFWELVDTDMDANWYMMCPHEIMTVKGYSLEDTYGEDWKEKYLDCVADDRISKRVMSIKDMVRLIIKSVTETGTPFLFNRDKVNEMNPNSHKGMIYSSNLCTEIAQNMSPIESCTTEIVKSEDGDDIVVTKTKAGDFVVCNLASLVLGNIDVNNKSELENVIRTSVRALDNVIELNYYPLPYAKITNKKYRSIGLGVNGYHHMLSNNGIEWESDEHIQFADEIFEDINYFAIKASNDIAKEKGRYEYFEGSEWQTGKYFEKRNYESERWNKLKSEVAQNGMRNGYLMAIAPTSSTSIIAGTTAGIDPVMSQYFLEEKKGMIIPRVAPNLNSETVWLYQSAHSVDQNWTIKAASARGRHIDQAQSLNLYITTDFTMRQVLNLLLEAWKHDVKTIYYVRSKALEVSECDVCSA